MRPAWCLRVLSTQAVWTFPFHCLAQVSPFTSTFGGGGGSRTVVEKTVIERRKEQQNNTTRTHYDQGQKGCERGGGA